MRHAKVLIVLQVMVQAVAVPAGGSAQEAESALEYGRSRRMASQMLGETRIIDVTLPASYDRSADRRYPVLVVLDGESQQQVAAALVRFQAAAGHLPEMIVVGVRNTDRNRDLSPPLAPGFRAPPGLGNTFGGGDRFLAFLGDELLPQLDRDYRTVPFRVLVGHSIGGTFAQYALVQRGSLFNGYVVMEPSNWWNNQKEMEEARRALLLPASRRLRVVVVNGQGLGTDTLSRGGSAPLLRHLTVAGETHVSMPAAGILVALQAMFADFRPAPWRPGTRPIAMIEQLDSLAYRVGYTVPIPPRTFMLATRMSLDSRHFEDAERALRLWVAALGESGETREFGERLALERTQPAPPGFVPLEVPARRPTPRQAAGFLGRWTQLDRQGLHELEIRAAGDTIAVHSREQFEQGGQVIESAWPVVQLTPDGTLEIGAPYLRGVAGLVVFSFRRQADGSLAVTRQVRGFAPPDGHRLDTGPLRYRRLGGGQ